MTVGRFLMWQLAAIPDIPLLQLFRAGGGVFCVLELDDHGAAFEAAAGVIILDSFHHVRTNILIHMIRFRDAAVGQLRQALVHAEVARIHVEYKDMLLSLV